MGLGMLQTIFKHDGCGDPGTCEPTPIRNQFHANFGGPIVKDKAFLFGFYEGQRLKSVAVAAAPFPPQET
jgi:hypothetical protein